MYDAAPASDLSLQAKPLQRVRGAARIRFSNRAGATRLADLYQKGSAKVRMPRIYGGAPTAVLINTAGGLTGGDELEYDVAIGDDAHAIVTSQTAERAYRSNGGSAKVTGSLRVGARATLEWLPQETLLFDRSSLSRTLRADLARDARLMMLETVVLGRTAMGETIERLSFKDRWRIRRAGKLVFADDIRIDGVPEDILRGPATAGGGHVFATFVDCAADAGDRLSLARTVLDALPLGATRFAVSSWNDLLVARLVSSDGRDLRNTLISFLTGYRAADLPRVWYC
ncbi:urease accessory protein UreD [Roseibium sp. HPY-6]|uniref:urease accessory protein UreD n=1 Tax=Roseibium sp. HPY-6 TaxID=3229852 RepID=UPI00338FA9F8